MLRFWLGNQAYRIVRSTGAIRSPRCVDAAVLLRQAVYAGHRVPLQSLLYPATPAPSWLTDAQLITQALAAIAEGRLAVETVGARNVGWAPLMGDDGLHGAAGEPGGMTTEVSETWLELRLLDEIGSPIEGVTLRMTPGGPRPTDGAGAARVTLPAVLQGGGEVQSIAELRARVATRWDVVRPEPWIEDAPRQRFVPLIGSPSTSVALQPERPYTLVIQPWVMRAHLDGLVFDTNKCFLLPDAVHRAGGDAPIDRLRDWFDAHPDTMALVVGHTDPSGEPSYNDPLSLERAASFIAFLTGDVDAWMAYYSHPAPEKRWGIHEDRSMLEALADRWGFPEVGRVQAFQAWAGITVDGIIGPQTRGALITAYMDLQDTSTAMPASLVAHGCGESFPKMEKPDRAGVEGSVVDPDAEDQRRVEVFLFPAATGVQPPPPATVSPAGSLEYPEWVRRARRTRDLRANAGLARLTARVGKKRDLSRPVAAAQVTLIGPEGDETTLVQVSGDDGLAHFEGLEPGRYHVRAEKDGYEGDARYVQVRRSGVTDEDDLVMSVAEGNIEQGADEVPLGLDSTLTITKFEGKTPHWPPTDTSTQGHERWESERFVYFRQGADILIEWEVESPEMIEVELLRMGWDPTSRQLVEKTTRWSSEGPGQPPSSDPVDEARAGPTRDGNLWRGSIRLSLRAREPDGKRNPLYAPPRAEDDCYRLNANEKLDIYMLDEAAFPVAGIAFFGAVSTAGVELHKTASSTSPEVLHATHGSLFADKAHHWTAKPHGLSPPGAEVRLEWELVGTGNADMQLEVLGAAPVSLGEGDGALKNLNVWPLEKMSLIQHGLGRSSGTTVTNDLVTLRAMIHVFAKGVSTTLAEAQWRTPQTDAEDLVMTTERHGGSALRVAEHRPLKKLVFTYTTKDPNDPDAEAVQKRDTAWLPAIAPFAPKTRGYYRAFRPRPPPKQLGTGIPDEYRGRTITLEIIERAGRIWAQTRSHQPMALWHIFAASGHATHGFGQSWDLLCLRKDKLEEYRVAEGKPYSSFTLDLTEYEMKTFIETMARDARPPTVYPPDEVAKVKKERGDHLAMERLLQLFLDLVPLCTVTDKDHNLRIAQLIYDDKQTVAGLRERRGRDLGRGSKQEIGTEEETGVRQGTHGWHAHLFLSQS